MRLGSGDALHGGEGKLVGPPDLKRREGQSAVEGRADQGLAGRGRGVGPVRRAAIGEGAIHRRLEGLRGGLRGRGALGRQAFGQRREGRGGANGNKDLPDRPNFSVQSRSDMPEIMGLDPALEKACWNRETGLPRSDRIQGETAEPAVENGVAHLRPQAIAAAPPGFAKGGTPAPPRSNRTGSGSSYMSIVCLRREVDCRRCGDAKERDTGTGAF